MSHEQIGIRPLSYDGNKSDMIWMSAYYEHTHAVSHNLTLFNFTEHYWLRLACAALGRCSNQI